MTNKTEKKLARKERIEELKAQAIETYENQSGFKIRFERQFELVGLTCFFEIDSFCSYLWFIVRYYIPTIPTINFSS